MESEPMPSSLAVLTSPGYRISDDGNAHDSTAFTSLSAANIQLMTSQTGIEQLLSLAHHQVDNAVAAQFSNDRHEATSGDGEEYAMLATLTNTKTSIATTLSQIVSTAVRTLRRNTRGQVGGSPAFMTLATAEVGEARYNRLKAGFTKLKDHVNDVADHRDQLLRSLDQLHADTISLQETSLCLMQTSAFISADCSSSLAESCAAIDEMKNVLEQKVAKQTSRKLAELQLFEVEKLDVREKLRHEVNVAEKQLQGMRTDVFKRGHQSNRKHVATMCEITAKRQKFHRLRRRLTIMTEALEHVFQFHFQLDQCIAEPELATVRSHLHQFFQHNHHAYKVLHRKL